MADDDYAPLMIGTWKQLDALARTIYLESVSFDELQQLSKNKEQLSTAVPAIWPIDRKALRNNHIGAFNPRRFHPILHSFVAHEGIDLGCNRGTPVYATAAGVVTSSGSSKKSGSTVEITHEGGYVSVYAHLENRSVRRGQRVEAGQQIGTVGMSGRSFAPHLHYELHLNGRTLDPVNYFFGSVTPAEYANMLYMSVNTEQSMD